jgi:Domain of unknown function (DUF4760)
MGVGPYWNSRVDLQQALDWTTSELSSMWGWVQSFADSHVMYAPLMTPVVAVGAGCIAIYAVHVQRAIARKRAATDFFLKTEMDESLLKRFSDFESKVEALNAAMTPTTTMAELSVMPDYPSIRSYLNIHELIAVGIRLEVFDRKVCYHYWSNVFVDQCNAAEKVIAVARRAPEHRKQFSELLELKYKWERKLRRHRWWQGLPMDRAPQKVAPPSSPMSVQAPVPSPNQNNPAP